MAVIKAWLSWTGPELDVLGLWVDDLTLGSWIAAPVDEWGWVVVLREVDEHDEETGHIAGLEIVDFLDFDRWDDLPRLSFLWRLPEWKPLPLEKLLKRKQKELRQQELADV